MKKVPLGTIHTNDGFLTRRQEEQIIKVPAGRHKDSDGGVNNLSAAVFKSKSAYSMRLLMTYLKDRKKE